MLRPQRGSRTRLITGAQYVEYALPAFMKARASTPMAWPVADQTVRLKEPAVVIGRAKLVSSGVLEPGPSRTCEMPWVASLHQLYAGRPTDGSGPVPVPSALIFSGMVSRLTMSAARSLMPRVTSQNFALLKVALVVHGLTRYGPARAVGYKCEQSGCAGRGEAGSVCFVALMHHILLSYYSARCKRDTLEEVLEDSRTQRRGWRWL
jgi:hypothetical protein